MNARTLPLTAIPDMLGAFDASIHSMRREWMAEGAARQQDPDLAQRRAWFRNDLQKLIDKGDMGAYVFSATRRYGGRLPTVHEVLTDAIAESSALQRMVNLNTFYGEGEATSDLRRLIVEVAAENEVSE